jgi:hypothetical protein
MDLAAFKVTAAFKVVASCKIAASCEIVTPGLDPGVYLSKMMDGRVEPGHDS